MLSGTFAVILMCIATFLTAFGIILMKKAHNDKQNPKIVMLRTPWILGLCFKVISANLAVFSFSMANQSTLSPLSALTMVYNILLAWKILGEPLDKYDLLAVVMMCSGAVISEIYSTKTTESLNYNDLNLLFSRKIAVLYIFGGYVIYISLYIISRNVISKGQLHRLYVGKIPLITFGSFTGFQSGITGLCLKSSVELIKTQYTGSHNFDYHPAAVLFPIATLISVLIHLFLLNSGLKYYTALQMVPVVQSSMIVYNSLTGGIVLNEFITFSQQAKLCFPLGTVICCLGLFVIMFKNKNDPSFEISAKSFYFQSEEASMDQEIQIEKYQNQGINNIPLTASQSSEINKITISDSWEDQDHKTKARIQQQMLPNSFNTEVIKSFEV